MFQDINYLEKQNTINIDHHADNTNFGKLNIVKSKDHSSNCEIVFEIIEELWKDKFDEEIATYLYL
jgi:nanoRNase/pAp phosphatase (c-di-AMP/oligoRNAs hydrolase)